MLVDAIMFFDELDILDIRLHELNPIVDLFVIVESLETHGSYNTKRANLRDNWHIVQPFEHKIKYVVLDRLQPEFNGSNSWDRENYHRNCLLEYVPNDAIVMISDCDEIPRATVLIENIDTISKEIRALSEDFFYYNVNNYLGNWNGTVVGPVDSIKSLGGAQTVRNNRDGITRIPNAGWHFSYFGDIRKIRTKVENFAHASDLICKEFSKRSDEEIINDILSRKDLYHRDMEKFHGRDTNDSRLPNYFLNNLSKFEHFTEDYFRRHNENRSNFGSNEERPVG